MANRGFYPVMKVPAESFPMPPLPPAPKPLPEDLAEAKDEILMPLPPPVTTDEDEDAKSLYSEEANEPDINDLVDTDDDLGEDERSVAGSLSDYGSDSDEELDFIDS